MVFWELDPLDKKELAAMATENTPRRRRKAMVTVAAEAAASMAKLAAEVAAQNPRSPEGAAMVALATKASSSMAALVAAAGENPPRPRRKAMATLAAEASSSMAKLAEVVAEKRTRIQGTAMAPRVAEAVAMAKMVEEMAEEEEEEEEEEAMALKAAPWSLGTSSSDPIMQTGDILLWGMFQEQVKRCGDPQVVALSQWELGGPPQCPPSPDTKRLSKYLCCVADKLDSDTKLQSMMEQVGHRDPKEYLFRVATELFSNGTFTWGRVITYLYFACKMVVKALWQRIVKSVKAVWSWIMEFLKKYILPWIKGQGGWKGLLSCFGTSKGEELTTVATSTLTVSLATLKMS